MRNLLLAVFVILAMEMAMKSCVETIDQASVPPSGTTLGGTGPAVTERAACAYTCPNNFSVNIIPYSATLCNCLTGYIEFETGSGTTQVNLQRNTSNGVHFASTGFSSICAGSHLKVCMSNIGESWCGDCFSGDITVSYSGGGFVHYEFCAEITDAGHTCVDLGTVSCCQSGSLNCYLDVNPDWDADLVECTPCGTAYDCD